jgi:hypothetical protein
MYLITAALLVCIFVYTDAILVFIGREASLMAFMPSSWVSPIIALAIYLILLGYAKAQQEQWLQTMFELNTFKVQNDYEQRQLKERSTLIDMLSHELKNPLATLRMALSSLKSIFERSGDRVEISERFSSMSQSIDSITGVIDRIGQVDAIDQRNFVVQYEKCAAIEMIERLPLVIRYPDRFKVLGLREISVYSDRGLFVTIINNLIDNAVKYSTTFSTIEISVSISAANQFMCTISNEVESDHEPDSAALFSRYYRGRYSHDKPGTGLGLVLVKSLCEILKGSINYRFIYNRVFFVVELPL